MGNFLFGQRCDHPSDESVINLSDSCIDKLMKSSEYYENVDNGKADMKIDDDMWIRKLRCQDELHSKQNQITLKDIEILLKSIEGKIGSLKYANCKSEDLIQCLKQNERCIIKCEAYMNEFIDCVDTARVEAIKKLLKKTEQQICDVATSRTCLVDVDDSN